MEIPDDILLGAEEALWDLCPKKSKGRYEKEFEDIKSWMTVKKVETINEIVLLAYFNELEVETLGDVELLNECAHTVGSQLAHMEKYEQLSVVGEGSYGVVMKCRHRDTDTIVAIKKFLETEEDATVRRMALREIRMLKRLRHENLVTMIEVFRHRKRFYLVFEYMEGTVLDELEKYPDGLGDERTRERIYQVTRAVQYCHSNHIIHRDVKPENVLVSSLGVVKLCDFGFARLVGTGGHDAYTEYVATRWYRAPELLVGEAHYGPPVDVWAIGCLFSEMMTGEPLFPGDSDIDQLYLIIKLIGKPCSRHQQLMAKNSQLRGMKRSSETNNLYKLFPSWSLLSLDFLSSCMKMDPTYRPSAEELLKHNFFLHDRFPEKFLPALRDKVRVEFTENPLLRKFKVDILMSSYDTHRDRKEEPKTKRTLQVEPPRWKINFVQDSVKRKYSTEENSIDSRSIISLSKVSQKLSSVNKLGQFSRSTLQSLKRDDKSSNGSEPNLTKYNNHSFIVPKLCQESCSKFNQKDNPRLEKALDLLTKLNQKNQCRPKSTNKDLHQYNNNLSPSPPEFQSLQSQSFREPLKSPAQVLHPNITTISFNKDVKKSPFLIQSINDVSVKSVFKQVPLSNPPKAHHLKRLDRSVVVDTSCLGPDKSARFKSPPDWLSSVGIAKRDSWKGKDEFTLPILPGATSSPSKPKKKTTPDHPEKVQTPKINKCGDTHKVIPTVSLKQLIK